MTRSLSDADVRFYEVYVFESEAHFYVGLAWGCTAAHRERMHRSGRGSAKALWDAIRAGVQFDVRVIESGATAQLHALEAEQRWIDHFLGSDLRPLNLNLTPAETAWNTSPAVIEKMRLSAQARARRPGETEARSRAAKLGHERRPELAQRMRTDNPVQYLSDERRRSTDRQNTGKTRTPEQRQRYSESAAKQWADPASREKRVAAIRAGQARRRERELTENGGSK